MPKHLGSICSLCTTLLLIAGCEAVNNTAVVFIPKIIEVREEIFDDPLDLDTVNRTNFSQIKACMSLPEVVETLGRDPDVWMCPGCTMGGLKCYWTGKTANIMVNFGATNSALLVDEKSYTKR